MGWADGADGVGGQAHRRTRAPSGRADELADGRTSGRGRTMGEHADGGGRAHGQADGRTGGLVD